MLRLNPTRLRRYFRCERDWFAYAVECVEPRTRYNSPGQARGKATHALLEFALREYVRTGEVFDFAGEAGYSAAEAIYERLFQDEAVALSEEDAYSLLDAMRYHVPKLNLPAWEVLTIMVPDDERPGETKTVPAIELRLTAPVPGVEGVELESIIDVVFRHRRTGAIWLVDWKTTFNAINTAQMLPYIRADYQFMIERWVLALHGVNVDMSAKVHLRSVAPTPPPITKRRKVSRNKSKLACDWEMYRKAIVDNNEDPYADDVQEVREELESSTFLRWRQDITDAQTEQRMREQVIEAARRMRELADHKRLPLMNLRDAESRTFKGCSACDYDKWCAALLSTATGAPDLTLLATDYRARPDSPYAARSAVQPRPPYNPDDAYIAFAAAHGQRLQLHEEFRP